MDVLTSPEFWAGVTGLVVAIGGIVYAQRRDRRRGEGRRNRRKNR